MSSKCAHCGYDLRGLSREGRCPECGAPIRSPALIDAPMSDMPLGVIRHFRTACWIAAVVATLGVLAIVGRSWLERLGDAVFGSILLGLSLAWVFAIWRLTPAMDLRQARTRGFGRHGIMRWVTRVLQLCWIGLGGVTLALALVPATATMATPSLETASRILILACVAAMVTACIMLERLAEWTRDDTAQAAFTGVAWGLPAACVLMSLNLPLIGILGLIVRAVILPLIVCVLFPGSLIMLARSLSYAVAHGLDAIDREDRRRERQRRYDEQVARAVRRDGAS